MLIGILSDTHGRVDAARQAVDLLRQQGAQLLIHCGDVGSRGVIDLLAGAPAAFVWGNNDFDRDDLAPYAASLGVQCLGDVGTIPCGARRLAVTHGDNAAILTRILQQEKPDYLFTGHSHIPHDRRIGTTRWINPGALHRAPIKTIALLDTDRDELRNFPITLRPTDRTKE